MEEQELKIIGPELYSELARKVLEEVNNTDFYQGEIITDNYKFASTIVVYRDMVGKIIDLLPVWWEFEYYESGIEIDTDFEWRELQKHFGIL